MAIFVVVVVGEVIIYLVTLVMITSSIGILVADQ